MYVLKRNGKKEPVSFDKITKRICHLAEDLHFADGVKVAQKVVSGVFAGVRTSELDILAAETAAYMSTVHPEYGTLAARIAISNLHKQTGDSWKDTVERLHKYVNPKSGKAAPLIADDVYKIIMDNIDVLEKAIDCKKDFTYDYFGFKTLCRSYLLKLDGKIVERPQYMLMRVAVGIHKLDIEAAIETYQLMSDKMFTHASPTLFNSGTPVPQMSSCFLVDMKEDSIEGIYDTLKICAQISKSAGGIGVATHKIRASGSYIAGTNGVSNGLVPMLRVYNATARYVDQGGGKRKGAFAMYLEPWHADIFHFLELKKNHGVEELRARDLFYALWISDLFMERVREDKEWSLFCPHECPGLPDVHGDEFRALYAKYEAEGRAKKVVKAGDLWKAVLESQIETGTPYMLYKDAVNAKSNQKNLGTIKSSNLCTEIMEYTAPDEVAVCNLASIALNKFVNLDTLTYDHAELARVVKIVTKNMNKIIDGNFYPVEEARRSNMRHRPIGLGVQGLADAFILMRLPFDSPGARKLNKEIFETMYHAALTASMELAKRDGPYSTFKGSPASKGILQYDMWGVTPSKRWDWASLKAQIAEHGIRNSLLMAPMPTASTSQILGNNECFEPYKSNMYTRRVLAGDFTIINQHLLKDLIALGLWNKEMKNKIIAGRGSVQHIAEIPAELKALYRTVWELKQRGLVEMAADRGAFIDQSQSFNAFFATPTMGKLTSFHFFTWKKGLKTGMYYLRSRPAANAIQFTVAAKTATPAPVEDKVVEEVKKVEVVADDVAKAEDSSPKSVEEASKPKYTIEAVVDAGVCRMENGCVSCGS